MIVYVAHCHVIVYIDSRNMDGRSSSEESETQNVEDNYQECLQNFNDMSSVERVCKNVARHVRKELVAFEVVQLMSSPYASVPLCSLWIVNQQSKFF